MHGDYCRAGLLRPWPTEQVPHFMRVWTLPHRHKRLINDLLTDSDVFVLHGLPAANCLRHDFTDGKIGPYNKR